MNEIQEILSRGFAFDEGMEMLRKYSRNPGIISFVGRKHNMGMLSYELAKLARNPRLKPNPGYSCSEVNNIIVNFNVSDNPASAGPSKPHEDDPADDSDADEIVHRYDLAQHKNTRLEDMPTPELREKWLEKDGKFKELQYCHSQMKLANSNEGRAEWRRKLLAADEAVKEIWQFIDSEIERIENEKIAANVPQPEQSEDVDKIPFNVQNYRSYIAKALKEENLSDEKIAKVKSKVAELLKYKVAISDETIQKLTEKNLM